MGKIEPTHESNPLQRTHFLGLHPSSTLSQKLLLNAEEKSQRQLRKTSAVNYRRFHR